MSSPANEFENTLRGSMSRLRLAITDEQIARLRVHFEAVVETNRAMNLTRITDPAEAAVKHYADSLALLAWVRDHKPTIATVLDVGTGAGFPSLPLAVMQPEWSVTAIDGTGKKIDFLRRATQAIGLSNLACTHANSAEWPTRERFDLVTFRARAALPRAIERSAKFVAPGGWLIAYQTAAVVHSDLHAAESTATGHGLSSHKSYPYELCHDGGILARVLLVFHRPG